MVLQASFCKHFGTGLEIHPATVVTWRVTDLPENGGPSPGGMKIQQSLIQLRPAQIVTAEGQIPEALTGDLEYGVADRRLDRSGAVMAHTEQPVPGLEETDVDLGRVLVDARQLERIEIILNDVPVFDRVRLVHRVVVEPGDLTFDLLLHR